MMIMSPICLCLDWLSTKLRQCGQSILSSANVVDNRKEGASQGTAWTASAKQYLMPRIFGECDWSTESIGLHSEFCLNVALLRDALCLLLSLSNSTRPFATYGASRPASL